MTLEQHWQHLKTLPQLERSAYMEQQIQPALFERLEPTLPVAPLVSVHTLGTSIEPVVIAARRIGAPSVVLLGTETTLSGADRVQKQLAQSQSLHVFTVERSGTRSVYAATRQAIGDAQRVALEVTSGTKAMVAALAMLAVALRLEGRDVGVYYVDNPRWDQDLRRPEPGYEQLLELELP